MLTFYLAMIKTEEDRDKVTYIYEHFYPLMKHIALAYVKKSEDADDIVHESMISIIEYIDKIDTSAKNKLKNFCSIVARNKALDFCKTKENGIFYSDDESDFVDESTEIPEKILLQNESHTLILKTIYSLSDIYRDVCILKYIHQFKEKDIATLLNINQKTVGVRIFRARKILREALRKEFIRG